MKQGRRLFEHASAVLAVALVCGLLGLLPSLARAASTEPESATGQIDETGPASGTSATAGPLADTGWRLLEFRSMDDAIGTIRPNDPSFYTMFLSSDGTVSMNLGCNRATGTWSAESSGDGSGGRFGFGPLASTSALCPPPSMDERILADSEFVRSYLQSEGRLYLSLMADAGIYAWERDPSVVPAAQEFRAAAPWDGGPRDWEVLGPADGLELRAGTSDTAGVIASYEPGTVLDNLGCESADGIVWCYVQELGGGPVGYVESKFLRPAESPDGTVATGPDDSALRAGQGDFDAVGSVPCAQFPGQPMGECDFGVSRAGGGYATVVVVRPDGGTRAIFFRMGKPVGADTSQADGYPEFSASKEADLHLIRVGDERYEIPEAVVMGG